MSTDADPPSAPPPAASPMAKLAPLAPQILIGSAVVGLISCFLPAVTVSVLGVSKSVAVFEDWRGKLGLVAYVGVGVMAFQMMTKKVAPRPQLLAVLITSGVAVLLALMLLVSVGNATGSAGGGPAAELLKSGVKTGIGCYLDLLASLAMAGGAVVLAKQEKLF
jgi:hypothetical protein